MGRKQDKGRSGADCFGDWVLFSEATCKPCAANVLVSQRFVPICPEFHVAFYPACFKPFEKKGKIEIEIYLILFPDEIYFLLKQVLDYA